MDIYQLARTNGNPVIEGKRVTSDVNRLGKKEQPILFEDWLFFLKGRSTTQGRILCQSNSVISPNSLMNSAAISGSKCLPASF